MPAERPEREALLEADGLNVLYGDYQILWDARFRVEPGEVVEEVGRDATRFRAPAATPGIAAVLCAFLVGPWAGRPGEQYALAAALLLLGVLLWGATRLGARR